MFINFGGINNDRTQTTNALYWQDQSESDYWTQELSLKHESVYFFKQPKKEICIEQWISISRNRGNQKQSRAN
jgi:hypothetical protein